MLLRTAIRFCSQENFPMKKLCLAGIALFVALAAVSSSAHAQSDQSPAGASFNVRQAAVAELREAQKELVSLAQATPADKYTWRPGEGVRSIAEVYLHICAGNFGLTGLTGVTPKPGFKFQGYENSTTEKAQVIDQLNQSFDFAVNGISSLSDADLQKPVKWPTYPTVGDVVLHIVAHAHEHLGQSIAYARMNGIVPPWTAAAQQRTQGQTPRPSAPRPPQE